MKRAPLIAAIAVSAALLAPQAGAASEVTSTKLSTPQDWQIAFRTAVRDGKIVKVKKFRFADVSLDCDQGGFRVSTVSPLPAMKVSDNEFGDSFTNDAGQVIKVTGRFHRGGESATGTLRIRGDFVDQQSGQQYTNCDSGRLRWAA